MARQAQAGRGGTIGEHLVLAGVIDDEALAAFYRVRLMVPQVKPEQLTDISESLLSKIPPDMAAEFRCIPVACDRDRNLTLAMADPSTTHTVDEISFFTGHYVVRAVATQSQIAWCLARYYGRVTPLAERLMGANRATGPGGLPRFPMPGAIAPEKSGPIAGEAHARGPSHDLPLPAPSNAPRASTDSDRSELRAQSSPVPVVIDNDRRSTPPPYVPPETREPMISFIQEETAPTGPMRLLQRKQIQPPELEDRVGEFDVPSQPVPQLDESLPAVMVSPQVESGTDSRPILLDDPRPRRDATPRASAIPEAIGPTFASDRRSPPGVPEADDEVVLLDHPKDLRRRHRRTRLGLGITPNAKAQLLGHESPSAVPDEVAAAEPGPDEAVHDPDDDRAATDPTESAAPRMAASELETLDVPLNPARARAASTAIDDDDAVPAAVSDEPPTDPDASPLGAPASTYDYSPDSSDRLSWGPPGTTIPPIFLNPLPDSAPSAAPLISDHVRDNAFDDAFDDADVDAFLNQGFDPYSETAPAQVRSEDLGIDIDESEPIRLLGAPRVAPPAAAAEPAVGTSGTPTPTEVPRPRRPLSRPFAEPIPEPMSSEALRALEDSSLRLVEILRKLDQADSRNTVIDTLIDHLAESHQRVAFFAVRSGELATWKQRLDTDPIRKRDGVKLNLDEPSTFQDIVSTRLPFRGPLTDSISRAFVAAALGYSAGQILALPVSVRGRVVGVLYGDTCQGHIFEQHLAVVTRAAGVALERILRARKHG
ncbi:hypothetical protein [Haliangium sp.]|uniref:GspE/PulE/PilB domain-containing protein n=1 Tax=Haliangium sp. TaxID=2663208 RepID=UPI003D1029A2